MAQTAYNVLEEQYELYANSSSSSAAPSSSKLTLDHQYLTPSSSAQASRDRHRRTSGSDQDDTLTHSNSSVSSPVVTSSQKAIASLTGAIVTSVFMTPFDVIKTRLQVQSLAPPPPAEPISFEPHHAPHLLRPQAAGASSASGSASSLPNPPSRGLGPAGMQRYHLNGLLDGVAKVWRVEGATGLWRGLSPTLVMTVPSQVTYMTCYDYFRTIFLSFDEQESPSSARRRREPSSREGLPAGPGTVTLHSLYSSLAAGALARAISATLVTPIELVRTRTQASGSLASSSKSGKGPSLSSIIRTLATETSTQGPTVLWRGLGSTLWRDVPFSAVYFAGYEGLKRVLTGGGLGEGHASNHSAEFGISFLSGSVSGSVAALLTQPADVIKTRLQTEQQQQQEQQKGRSGVGKGSATIRSRSTLSVAREILEKEGAAGLFKGMTPRIAKVAPACGVMIASFEVVGRVLASRDA
ncbi:Carrier protein, mitochondrial [Tilletia horrida]|uniref:Carrier protein, mitochondrial n=1 Tax=Tilletia horrida TaxID=155126 RepID=A0AAN6GT51_9BASI|nr:Carrier protein, mitochondrial [Tilletia horrida]KAK0556152.1 Carrier protein, mitochondrial [Tilletia horrida]KAK0569078.1 Carrier protein, mitochondrial [Tilletia horrida]